MLRVLHLEQGVVVVALPGPERQASISRPPPSAEDGKCNRSLAAKQLAKSRHDRVVMHDCTTFLLYNAQIHARGTCNGKDPGTPKLVQRSERLTGVRVARIGPKLRKPSRTP